MVIFHSKEEQILLETQNLQLEPHKHTWTKYIYVWFEDRTVTPFCTKEKSFTITLFRLQHCLIMLTSLIATPTHSPADTNGGVYYSGTNKGLPILTPGTIITSTKSIFVYKETTTIP
jgi:hypothetical protein